MMGHVMKGLELLLLVIVLLVSLVQTVALIQISALSILVLMVAHVMRELEWKPVARVQVALWETGVKLWTFVHPILARMVVHAHPAA